MWKYRSTQPDPQRDWLKPVFNPLEMTRFWPTTWLTQPNPPVLPCLETSDQSHLRKTQWLVTISLTFGNHLKFGQNSYHTFKDRLTFLHQETEHPKLHTNHTHQSIKRGLQQAPRVQERHHGEWLNEDPRRQFSTPIEAGRQLTPLVVYTVLPSAFANNPSHQITNSAPKKFSVNSNVV